MFRAEECSLIVPTYSAITASYASLQLFPLPFEKFVINEILEIRIPRDITRDDISKRVCLSISEISLCKCVDTKGERNDSHSQFLCGFSSKSSSEKGKYNLPTEIINTLKVAKPL